VIAPADASRESHSALPDSPSRIDLNCTSATLFAPVDRKCFAAGKARNSLRLTGVPVVSRLSSTVWLCFKSLHVANLAQVAVYVKSATVTGRV
jgi:hypothetical protein